MDAPAVIRKLLAAPRWATKWLGDRKLAIVGFLLTIAYFPYELGAATTLRWAILWVGLPLIFDLRLTEAHIWLGAFLAWSAASLIWSPFRYDGIYELAIFVTYGAAFCVGSATGTLRPTFKWMAAGLAVSSAIAIAQEFGFSGIQNLTTQPSGLFLNCNVLAAAGVLVLVGCLGHRLWLSALVVLPSALLPHSTGAYVALGLSGLLYLYESGRRKLVLVLIVLGLVGAAALVMSKPLDNAQRLDIWRDTIDGLTPLGNGIGSFYGLYPKTASRQNVTLERPDHAHSDPLELIYEMGPGAVLLFIGLLLCLKRKAPERHVLLCFIVMGLWDFPLHMPTTGFLALLCAGHLVRDRAGVLSPALRGRGPLEFFRWAGRRNTSPHGGQDIPV